MSRLSAALLSLLAAAAAAADSADLRVTVSGPSRIERGVTQVAWTATVENAGPDAAADVLISIGTFPYRDCRSELVLSFAAGERRTYECIGDVPPGGGIYVVQMYASAMSHATPDPNQENNAAWQDAEVITDPDVVALVNVPYRVDPGLPFAFYVTYRNVARTTATGVVMTVDLSGSEGFTRVPQECVVTGTRATCALGDIEPEPFPGHYNPRLLMFETVAPDRYPALVQIAAVARGNEPDPSSGNNESIGSTGTYRTFTVANTDDAGSGSLRAAIEEANASCNPSTADDPCKIAFRIPAGAAAWQTIRPATPLPAITAGDVIIDGTTQTRWFGDTNPKGPEIEINGSLLERSGNGITVAAACGGSVSHLVLNGFPDSGIHLGGEECTDLLAIHTRMIAGNYIGTDPTGTKATPNLRGIFIAPSGPDFRSPAWITQNVISGNRYSGVWVSNAPQTRIFRNRIGLNADLTAGLGNGASGVFVQQSASGTDLFDNYIGFNGHFGLSLATGTTEVQASVNSFQANGNLAIDYGMDGFSPSVPDGGEHPGTLQLHAPVIHTARYDASADVTVIDGTSSSPANPGRRSIFVTLYANDAPDESGYGEGQYLLGRAEVDGQGRFSFTHRGKTPGRWISALATSYHVWGFARTPGTQSRGGGYSTTSTEFARTVEVQ